MKWLDTLAVLQAAVRLLGVLTALLLLVALLLDVLPPGEAVGLLRKLFELSWSSPASMPSLGLDQSPPQH